AGQTAAIERTLAARKIAGFARCFTCASSVDCFVDDFASDRRILLEERAELFVYKRLNSSRDIRIQLALGLSFKLGLRQLHADDCDQPFADVIARKVFLYVFEQAHLLAGVVDGAGQRGAETGKVRAAVNRVDVVRETKNAFRIRVVVLQTDFHDHAVFLGFHVDRFVVEYLLATIQMLDEFGDAAVVLILSMLRFARLRIGVALVGQRDNQTLVQERKFAKALRKSVVVVFGGGENFLVRNEVNFRSTLLRSARFLQFAGWLTFRVRL